MPLKQEHDRIARVFDANANRLREGLRVVEEIVRLVLDNADLTEKLKGKRHAVEDLMGGLALSDIALLSARESEQDVGLDRVFDEMTRTDCMDILRANIRRAQESCRVLEEFSKLYDPDTPLSFKHIRFELYSLEKEIMCELTRNQHETC